MNENIIRTSIISACFIIAFLYLFYVLFKLEILQHKYYATIKQNQNAYVNSETERGTIFGTLKNGELFALAQDQIWYKLVISPKDVPASYEKRLYDLLNAITPIDRETFLQKCVNKKDSYEEIKVINANERIKIEDLSLPGVLTLKTYKRKYALNEIGARVIGFVGGGKDGFSGKYGLEKYYNSDLKSTQTSDTSFFTKIFDVKNSDNTENLSKNIVISLEPNLMQFLNKTLMDMKNLWQPDEASAIIMDIKTGQIVAMETVPEFDPNNYQNFEIKDFGNPSVQGVYELGSIMKPITMSGGLEAGLVTPETTYHDYGFVKIDGFTIWNFDKKIRGVQSMQDVINNSLNTGAVYVENLLGHQKFKDNFIKFGLEDQTEIDFPGEVQNQTKNLNTQTDVNFATAAFGQGVAITPISMLNSLSIIANQGQTLCPHFLVSKVLQDDSHILYECDSDPKQIISSTTAKTMSQMLITMIDVGLAHGRYKDKNYTVAAKTGTAQLPSPDGKYYKDRFVHSYFTFFPATNPRFSVLIYQVNPKKGSLASLTLAPVASKIKDFVLTYYNVPPDR